MSLILAPSPSFAPLGVSSRFTYGYSGWQQAVTFFGFYQVFITIRNQSPNYWSCLCFCATILMCWVTWCKLRVPHTHTGTQAHIGGNKAHRGTIQKLYIFIYNNEPNLNRQNSSLQSHDRVEQSAEGLISIPQIMLYAKKSMSLRKL